MINDSIHWRGIKFFLLDVTADGKGESLTIRDCHLQCFPSEIFPRNVGARGAIASGINTATPNESFFYPVSGHSFISFG